MASDSTFEIVAREDFSDVTYLLEVRHPLMARAARAGGCLVNVEDVVAFCDFHNPSQLRRGDLLLTVSTAGKSPGLAARIRAQLARAFGPEWAERLERIGQKREAWRREAPSLEELARLTNATIDANGWLPRDMDLRP